MSPALLFTLTLDHCACLSTAIPFIAHLYLLTMNAFMTSTFTITGTVLLVNVIFRRLQSSRQLIVNFTLLLINIECIICIRLML